MNRISRFALPLAFAAALTLGACSGEANIDIDGDSTAVDTTVVVVPVDTAVAPIDTTPGIDINIDSAATGAMNEGVEKLVEAKLMAAPGFEGVTVESEGDGVIVLTGTVTSDAEKANAETETKGTAGVKSVKNNITVKK